MKKFIFFNSILFVGSLTSCQVSDAPFSNLNRLDDSLNILNIQKTDYEYKCHRIYRMNIPKFDLYPSFVRNGYLMEIDSAVMSLGIVKECENSYLSNNYKIINDMRKITRASFNQCDILMVPMIDWKIKKGQIKYYYPEHSILLKNVFLDKGLNEYVYEFHRQWISMYTTVILTTRNRGIIGLYNINKDDEGHEIFSNPVGKTYRSNWSKFKSESLIWFKFRPDDLNKPDVNLNTINSLINT